MGPPCGRECGEKEEIVPDLKEFSGRGVCAGRQLRGKRTRTSKANSVWCDVAYLRGLLLYIAGYCSVICSFYSLVDDICCVSSFGLLRTKLL